MPHENRSSLTAPSQDIHPRRESLSVDDGSPNQDDDDDAGGNDKPKPPEPSVDLRRSVYMVFLVLLYGAGALYTWVVICILTQRPIGGIGYGNAQYKDALNNPPPDYLETTVDEYLDAVFAKSERYLRAMRIVQSVVSVLIIPLTSAVCSQAAVVYIQQKRGDHRPTLRQSMALADRGWTDIVLLTKLVFGGWKKYRSALLLFALFLNLLGATIFPVLQIFLSFKTIKRVGFPVSLTRIAEFTDLDPASGASGLEAVRLRATLASTVNTNVQPRLWSSSDGTVSIDDKCLHSSCSTFQTKTQNTLANLSTVADPFWAELPSGTNTGTLRQFAPRINSTATWEDNTAATLPEDCNPSSDAFYLHYEYDDLFQYNIEICMPGNMSNPPWENQMSRQDISEELYLKMNFSGHYSAAIADYGAREGVYSTKLKLDSTRGYFELPNYANGEVPGPLIEDDPFENSTVWQFSERESWDTRDLDNDTATDNLDATSDVSVAGPLASIATALFGTGSFVDVQHTRLAANAKSGLVYKSCIEIVPFISFLYESAADSVMSRFEPCLRGQGHADDPEGNDITMHAIAAAYFWLFSGDSSAPPAERVENAFASAAFLANDLSMANSQSPSISVSYDMGGDVQIPHISRAGIIFVSILLGVDLVCLLALAIYSAWIPRWTENLDSFAMLRIGASISEKFPLLAARHVGRIKALDETPGWIGDASDGEIGELRLGGERPLKGKRRYRSYSTEDVGNRQKRAT